MGSMTVLEFQGWGLGDFIVNKLVCFIQFVLIVRKGRYIISCSGAHTIEVDDQKLAADIYYTGKVRLPVTLEPGIHTIYVRI